MNVELGTLRPGQWRDLTPDEMSEINQAVEGSSKTAVNTTQPKELSSTVPKGEYKNQRAKHSQKENKRGTLKLGSK